MTAQSFLDDRLSAGSAWRSMVHKELLVADSKLTRPAIGDDVWRPETSSTGLLADSGVQRRR